MKKEQTPSNYFYVCIIGFCLLWSYISLSKRSFKSCKYFPWFDFRLLFLWSWRWLCIYDWFECKPVLDMGDNQAKTKWISWDFAHLCVSHLTYEPVWIALHQFIHTRFWHVIFVKWSRHASVSNALHWQRKYSIFTARWESIAVIISMSSLLTKVTIQFHALSSSLLPCCICLLSLSFRFQFTLRCLACICDKIICL